MVLSEELSILRKLLFENSNENSVLEELRLKKIRGLGGSYVAERSGGGRYLSQSCEDGIRS